MPNMTKEEILSVLKIVKTDIENQQYNKGLEQLEKLILSLENNNTIQWVYIKNLVQISNSYWEAETINNEKVNILFLNGVLNIQINGEIIYSELINNGENEVIEWSDVEKHFPLKVIFHTKIEE